MLHELHYKEYCEYLLFITSTPGLMNSVFIFQGGPCGVLACVQAFVLKNLLFESLHSSDTGLQ